LHFLFLLICDNFTLMAFLLQAIIDLLGAILLLADALLGVR
jgi:hypothetical protein